MSLDFALQLHDSIQESLWARWAPRHINIYRNNLVNTSDLSIDLKFAPRLVIFTDIVIDQVNGPNPGEDSWFEGEGLWVDDLFMQWSDQMLTFGGGIFTPNFGIANALAPGLFGGDFVGEVTLVEPMGNHQVVWLRRGKATLASLVHDGRSYAPGERVAFGIDVERVSLFDPVSGNRL